jgi:hypothetical protein
MEEHHFWRTLLLACNCVTAHLLRGVRTSLGRHNHSLMKRHQQGERHKKHGFRLVSGSREQSAKVIALLQCISQLRSLASLAG